MGSFSEIMTDTKSGNSLTSPLVFGGVGLALGIVGTWTVVQLAKRRTKPESKNTKTESEAQFVRVGSQEEQLLREQCTRNIQFLSEEVFDKVRGSKVVVIGLGGTGSHAAHMLARSGVGFLRLIDFDQVTLSSLNRHAVATRADVGKSKVEVMKQHLLSTVPALQCEAVQEIFSKENGARLILSTDPSSDPTEQNPAFKPDYVVDCIDNVETKVFLLAFCAEQGIPVMTSCGAGCRFDPTRLTICDISEAVGDPLLRATKARLAKQYKIRSGIQCLMSTEKPPRSLLPFLEGNSEEDPKEYQALPEIHMRVRIVPVLGPMPAIWGNAMAMFIITQLAQLEFQPRPLETRGGNKYFGSLLSRVIKLERKYFPDQKNAKVTKEDLIFNVEDLWNFESAVSGPIPPNKGKLTCVRWDTSKPISLDNMIPIAESEVDRHFNKDTSYSQEIIDKIEQKLAIYN